MKKSSLLILFSLLTLSSFSQTGTQVDSTKLPNYQLKLAIKDILTSDLLRKENKVLQEYSDSLQSVSSMKDSLIGKYQKSETLYKALVSNYMTGESNLKSQSQLNFNLYQAEKKEKKKFKFLTIVLSITTGVLVASKII